MPREIRANELLALKEIAEMLNTTNEMDPMLDDVLKKLLQVAGFTTGWIFLFNDQPGNLCAASRNLPPALTAGNYALMRGEDCSCIESYRQNKLDRAINIIECKRINYAIAHKIGDTEGITHHATVPLKAGHESFGLLNVAAAGKERFSEDELALLQAVALQIGTAIKRVRLYQAQEQNANLYAKLGDVIQQINSIPESHQFPVKAVRIIGDTFNWPHVSLFKYNNDQLSLHAQYKHNQVDEKWQALAMDQAGLVRTAYLQNRLIIESCSEKESCRTVFSEIGIPPYGSAAAIPLRSRGRPYGVLLISSPHNKQFDEYHEDFMYSLGDHFTLSIENLRIYEQRSELALLEERNRMARDLHDSVIQKVFSLSFLAKGAQSMLAGREAVIEQSLQEIGQLSQEVLKEMRSLIWQLRPAGLENGLLPALKQYAQRLDLTVYEQVEGVMELPRAIEEAFWRIGQEALNNVKKHAGTNTAYVRLFKSEKETSLEIADRGNGFATEKKIGKLTMGMMSMRERAEALGGEIKITSGKGKATTVKVTIPIHILEEKRQEEQDRL
ncbi:GAF domain-containing sensor histidine kinase [Cohnella cholangitidis]|uniref:histidine kinase n=1 Tax=Cohnella cholangitidis TaxID=2598458 RepID=A0A7G5BSJ7_9BACL|nr:GAF domain-containing sensor histidine kinase [Cohnella cholangitidis]QMV39931.1 GAF domain-containing sensor histidine kinase [Cohnella cholangitidis]